MRKYITAILIFTLIFLVGCNSDKTEKSDKESSKASSKGSVLSDNIYMDNETENTVEETTADKSEIYPNEVDMAKDIDGLGKNEINFPNDSYILETKSIEIEKATKNEKNFDVCCYAVQESDEYTARNYYNLVYNYYEIGGWILDECELITIDMKPKKICSEDLAYIELQLKYGLDDCQYESSEKVNDYEYIYHYKGVKEYNYMVENYDLIVYCNFSNELGWQVYGDHMSITCDYSKMYGTWYGEYIINGDYLEYTCKVDIKEIDAYRGTITFYIEVGRTSGIVTYPAEMTMIYENTSDWSVSELNYALYCVETELQTNTGSLNLDTDCDIYFDENYGLKMVRFNGANLYMSKVQ